MQKENSSLSQSPEAKLEEKLWSRFSKQMEDLTAQIDSTSESQAKLKIIIETCDKLAEHKTLISSKKEEFVARLKQLWTICTKDAKSIIRYQNPRNYQKISAPFRTWLLIFII